MPPFGETLEGALQAQAHDSFAEQGLSSQQVCVCNISLAVSFFQC